MAEYIDRIAFINKLEKIGGCATICTKECKECIDCEINVIKGMLRSIPAADVAPVVYGRWVYHNFDTICSECKKSATFDKWGQQSETDFCPNCGAKMDEEEHHV